MRKLIVLCLCVGLLVVSLIAFMGCGSGAGGGIGFNPLDPRSLVFHDANVVQGLFYNNGDDVGFTSATGSFDITDPTKLVEFWIGNNRLGTIDPSQIGNITAIDTSFFDVPGQLTNRVGNVTQLLQSVDDDGDITNGIDVRKADDNALIYDTQIDLDLEANEFQATNNGGVREITEDTTAGERDFIPRQDAEHNFEYYLDNGEFTENPAGGDGELHCVDQSVAYPELSCSMITFCSPTDGSATEPGGMCYWKADGETWMYECIDMGASLDAIDDMTSYCTNGEV
jgi:hypothetical protein